MVDIKEIRYTHGKGRNLAYLDSSGVGDCRVGPFNLNQNTEAIFFSQSCAKVDSGLETEAYRVFGIFM